ncbi:MAG: cupin domain-containing protein [Candidatus Dormibacteraceae bacterium]
MSKPEREFFAVGEIPWTPSAGQVPELRERFLAVDDATGLATSIMRFPPGTDTSANGAQAHDCWEEVLILEGAMTDLRLSRTFTAGMFACRPPGMEHGPWRSEDGCVTFQVRYRSPGARAGKAPQA